MTRKTKTRTTMENNGDDYVEQIMGMINKDNRSGSQSFINQLDHGSTGNDTAMLNKIKQNFMSRSGTTSGFKVEVPKTTTSSTDSSLQKNADELFEADISDIKKPSKPKSMSFSLKPRLTIKKTNKNAPVKQSNKTSQRNELKISMSSDFEEGPYDGEADASPDNLTLKTNSTDNFSKLSTKRIRTPAKNDYFDSDPEDIYPTPMAHDSNINHKKKQTNKVVKKSTKPEKTSNIKNKKQINRNDNKTKTTTKTKNIKRKNDLNHVKSLQQQMEKNDNKKQIIKDLIQEAKVNNKRVRLPPSLFEDEIYNYTTPNYKYRRVNGEMQPFLDESNPIDILELAAKSITKPKRKTRITTSKTSAANKANIIKPKKHEPFSFYGWYSDLESGSEKKDRLAVDDSTQEINYEVISTGVEAGVAFDSKCTRCLIMKMKPKSKTKMEKSAGVEVYHVLTGCGNTKLRVCIANSKFFARERVTFKIPEGNDYMIENVGNQEAELFVSLEK